MIKIKNLKKHYRQGDYLVKALDGVSVEIHAGEFVAVLGPSGSGKSTFMNILGCLDIPTEGAYELDGKEIGQQTHDELAEIRLRKVGFVFQNFNLLTRVSALKNVELPLVYSNMPRRERLEKARKFLKLVGLEGRENHLPRQLSGGQQQRVAIARSLINNPRIILADEPTGNLDSRTSNDIMAIFKDLNDNLGITIILVTHENDIAAFAKRHIVFKDGLITNDDRIKPGVRNG